MRAMSCWGRGDPMCEPRSRRGEDFEQGRSRDADSRRTKQILVGYLTLPVTPIADNNKANGAKTPALPILGLFACHKMR